VGRIAIDVVGTPPWPAGLMRGLPNSASTAIRLVITPHAGARAAVAERPDGAEAIVYSLDPSIVEATILIAAGANAYVTRQDDLAAAVRSVGAGEIWLAPVAAAAVCRLTRLVNDPTLDGLAAAARAAAAGQPWSTARQAADVVDTVALLSRVLGRI
jgi:DNA-binding NarL/FixJ family response regulator